MNKKLVVVLVIIVSVLGLMYSWLGGNSGREITTGIQVYTSPSDTTVKINGNVVKLAKNSRLELSPGEYTATGERNEFSPLSQKFTVSENKVSEVVLRLIPSSKKGQDLLATDKEQRVREELAYRSSVLVSESVAEKTPITSSLPAITADFRIDYGTSKISPDDPTKVSIMITTSNVPQQKIATDWIRAKGFNPEELEIYYRFYEN